MDHLLESVAHNAGMDLEEKEQMVNSHGEDIICEG
jgi:hypothetical protein